MKFSFVFCFFVAGNVGFNSIFLNTFAFAADGRAHATVTLGSGLTFEPGNDGASRNSRLPYLAGVGARLDRWLARIEYGSFRTTDGNATVSTTRQLETTIAWLGFDFSTRDSSAASWTPYASLGAGLSRQTSETRLLQSFETSRGTWAGMLAVAIGFRGEWTSAFHVRPELRYETAEFFKTKDARMGAFFQVDLVF